MESIEIKQMLAAVDFSAWTGPVLKTASEMARRYDARLTAVYAERFSPPAYFTGRDVQKLLDALEMQRDAARRHLADTVRREVDRGAPAESRLVEAFPSDGILKTAGEVDAGLIVLGTHGRSGLNRLLMGSVAEKVVRQSRVPVLTVRGSGEDAAGCRLPFRKVLCPVNYTEVAKDALRYAADVAQRFGAELTVLTCVEEDGAGDTEVRAQERALCDWVPEGVQVQCALTPLARKGEAVREILTLARDGAYDLVVIGAQHKPMLETTIFGTTSIRVMRHAACPVLTVVRSA